jgi:outer membrane protein assembly factor BamB
MPLKTIARRPLRAVLMLVAVLVLSSCSAVVLPEGWPGITVDGTLGPDGRYSDVRYLYVSYRDVVFRINPSVMPLDKPAERVVDWAAKGPNNAQFFVAPALGEDGTVYAGSYNHFVYAFSPNASPRNAQLSTFNSPTTPDRVVADGVVYKGRLYQGDARGLFVYNAQTGVQERSFTAMEFGVWSRPLIDPATNRLYVGGMDHVLYALDADTLELIWKTNRDEMKGSIGSAPLLVGDKIYLGTFANEFVEISAVDGKILRKFKTEGWIWHTPVLFEGRLYFGDLAGFVYVLNPETFELIWRNNDPNFRGGVRGRVAVVRASESLVVVLASNENQSVRAYDALDGRPLWTNGAQDNTGGRSSPPAGDRILGDVVVIGNDVITTTKNEAFLVVAYDLTTGVRSWSVRKPNNDDVQRLLNAPAN